MSTPARRTSRRSPPRAGHADAPIRPNTACAIRAAAAGLGTRDAARVAAGAVARLVIPEVSIAARVVEVGGSAEGWPELIEAARAAGSSLGAIVECVARGVPAGWGAPVYAKLDAELAGAIMSVNAVKGVEIGAGFGAARLRGEDNADPALAGGITGGIATGEEIVLRAAFKPTASVAMLGSAGATIRAWACGARR